MSLDQLAADGLTGPFRLADHTILDSVCEVALELQVLQGQQNKLAALAGKSEHQRWTTLINRHMAFQPMQELFRDVNLQAVVAEHFGTNLVLWQTKFFPKYPGVGENKWHHDRIIENGDDAINLYDTSNHFSFVIALTDLGEDAGRIEYIRGSHQPIDGLDRGDLDRLFHDMPAVVHDRIAPLTLVRGEFAIFHSAVLHRSLAYGHDEQSWRPSYFGAPNPEKRRQANIREGRVSLAARLARADTEIPIRSGANPAGAADAIAEPMPYFEDVSTQVSGSRSAVMPFN